MPRRISISFGKVAVAAELNDSPCARSIFEALPIEAEACTWGQEIYFGIGVEAALSDAARSEMGVGEVAYWPPGRALCVFFGRTPASGADGAPRAASDVEPVGRILGCCDELCQVTEGQMVVVSAGT